jgi:hypothetical protein
MERAMTDGAEFFDVAKPRGYQPRTLSVYERQIEEAWNNNKTGVPDIVDGWVRTVGCHLPEGRLDVIADDVVDYIRGRFESDLSPFAAVEEIRGRMIEHGLKA